MEKNYSSCQSCGMPFKNDPKGGGTNADGSKNHMYCSLCYQNGKFTQPEMTAAEMQEFVKGKLKELEESTVYLQDFFPKEFLAWKGGNINMEQKQIPAKTCFSHIGGKLGNLLMEMFIEKQWIKSPDPANRHFYITDKGKKEFKKLGIDLSLIKEEKI